MTKLIYAAAALLMGSSLVFGQFETGTGARAFSLANNHTALSAGICDLYWNPAALAFSVSREFQASLYGMKLKNTSTFFGTPGDEDLQRFRFGNAGFSFAVPASRGGMSIAAAYSNPVILDDVFQFSGEYILDNALVTVNKRAIRVVGNLDFWSGGFGLQVARNIGIGLSASLLTGKSTADSYINKDSTINGTRTEVLTDYRADGRYRGFDIRAGLFYKSDLFSSGMRLVFPQIIHHTEKLRGTSLNSDLYATDEYTMYSSYSGAWGISTTLPYITITAEIRTTMPYNYLFPVEEIPDTCQAGYFKSGGGIGIEVPVSALPAILRAGYSCDEPDLHQWMYDFNEEPDNTRDFIWSDNGMEVSRKLHKITCGIGFTSATTSFDIAYGFSTWGITTYDNLEQTYHAHRVLTSFAVRF